MAAKPTEDDPIIGVLRCSRCDRRLDCRQSQVIEYTQGDQWPRCCNEVMRLYGRDKGSSEFEPLKSR